MSSSFKLKIINYQRIRNADIEFIPGLNVIQGASNQGKSAILRALETAIYNIARESHVTIGETKSAVGIEYNNHEVIWRRDKQASSQVSYRIDGKIYTKVGRGQPEQVAEALGMTETEVNDRKFRVNFGKQMAYPFLLDSSPSEFFKFIVQSDEEDVTSVLDTMRRDFQEMKNNIKAYETSCNSLGEAYKKEATEYNELKPKLEYAKKIIDMDWLVKEYETLANDIETMRKSLDIVSNYGVELTKQSEIANYLTQTYDSLSITRSYRDQLSSKTQQYAEAVSSKTTAQESLDKEQKFLGFVTDLSERRNAFNQAQIKDAQRKSIESMLSTAKHYHEVLEVDTGRLVLMKSQVECLDEAYAYIDKAKDHVQSTASSRDSLKPQALEVFRLQKSIEELQGKITASERIIEQVEQELMSFDVCPRCGAPITKGRYCIEHD